MSSDLEPTALTIAGSDSSGGAGMQADLKTFFAHGVYGASVMTLVTAQNTRGVSALEVLDTELIEKQLHAVFDDLNVAALKTGALGSAEVIGAVADFLQERPEVPKVIDPVMISKHGDLLLQEPAREAFSDQLLPLATVVTPNRHEAEELSGIEVEDRDSAERAAGEILKTEAGAVLITSVPGTGKSVDLLATPEGVEWLETPLAREGFNHGSGCTLSSAVTANLAGGLELAEAVREAKQFTFEAMRAGVEVGEGINPQNHIAACRELID